ncbi:hypothetical protein QVD17_28305 [Tagetes erecta]|uniref:KANL3/Tex30 alpha/beta hydrolase-like domain-containing protein n=1 Tax=Tagetes erecta TaxID=13708 RepID=A0AAD8NSJ9_TARER|nr:hypothetical protein QVD17_28305 [Tagetes erecta]
MGPKRRRSAEGENKQQNRGSVVTRSKSSSSSSNNNFNSPVVVFAHGAGASSSSDWMIRWKNLLTDSLNAVEVVTFDYPYISKRRPPPKAEKLVEFHSDIVKTIASKYPQHPLVLVGKSMGSRVSCMVAAENGIRASAVVCLGYPLKGAKGAIRDEPLLQLTVPTMFVQGTKDGLCPLESLEVVRQKMKALSALHVVENGDHSLKIAKKNLKLAGISQEEAEQHVVQAIAMFVSQIIGSR